MDSDLEELLEVARDLGIRGLSQEDTQRQEDIQKSTKQKKKKSLLEPTATKSLDILSKVGEPTIKTEAFQDNIDYSKTVALELSESYDNRSHIKESSGTIIKEKDNKHGHECTSCGKSYSIKGALDRHVKEKHTNEAIFSCNQCDWNRPRQYLLVAHMKSAHGIIEQHLNV